MLSQPLLIWAGWLGMLVAVLIPFCVSIMAAVKYRGPSCFSNGVYFAFAPLIAVCEPVGLFWATVGWLFTTITVVGYLGAVLAGTVATWRAVRSSPRMSLVPPVFLLTLTGVVTGTILFVIASIQESSGIGGLIFLASIAALVAYAVTALARATVKVAVALFTRHK